MTDDAWTNYGNLKKEYDELKMQHARLKDKYEHLYALVETGSDLDLEAFEEASKEDSRPPKHMPQWLYDEYKGGAS